MTNRKQLGKTRQVENIEIGVPQGTILGPLLLSIYFNIITEDTLISWIFRVHTEWRQFQPIMYYIFLQFHWLYTWSHLYKFLFFAKMNYRIAMFGGQGTRS